MMKFDVDCIKRRRLLPGVPPQTRGRLSRVLPRPLRAYGACPRQASRHLRGWMLKLLTNELKPTPEGAAGVTPKFNRVRQPTPLSDPNPLA